MRFAVQVNDVCPTTRPTVFRFRDTGLFFSNVTGRVFDTNPIRTGCEGYVDSYLDLTGTRAQEIALRDPEAGKKPIGRFTLLD
jgi:hypothetical protein